MKGDEFERGIQAAYHAISLAVQKDAIRRFGCPVCGVMHRNGLTCKPFKMLGFGGKISTTLKGPLPRKEG